MPIVVVNDDLLLFKPYNRLFNPYPRPEISNKAGISVIKQRQRQTRRRKNSIRLKGSSTNKKTEKDAEDGALVDIILIITLVSF
jgi:hypothetical protein